MGSELDPFHSFFFISILVKESGLVLIRSTICMWIGRGEEGGVNVPLVGNRFLLHFLFFFSF